MTRPPLAWCYTFVTPDRPARGQLQVQWQFPAFTLACTAKSLDFARIILDFVSETRGNPAYRDIPLSGGVYRYMAEKSVDLSPHFFETRFHFAKMGDADDSYSLHFEHPGGAWITFRLYGDETDAFLEGLREIAD